MTDRDAFGNLIEPDRPAGSVRPLTGGDPLGATSSSIPPPAMTPPATQAAPPAPAAAQRSPRRRRLLGPLLGWIVALLVVSPFVIGGYFVYRTFHDTVKPAIGAVQDVRDRVEAAQEDGNGDQRTTAAPTGVSGHSLLVADRVERLLGQVRRDPGGRLLMLRLAPDRANVQLSHGDGLAILQVGWDGARSLTTTPSGSATVKSIIFSSIDTKAPARLVRRAAHRAGVSTKTIDYVVIVNVAGAPRWSAFFKGGAGFGGDAHGRIVNRIS
jgi:hypothetical protein